jgi:hypothetical protein
MPFAARAQRAVTANGIAALRWAVAAECGAASQKSSANISTMLKMRPVSLARTIIQFIA